MLLILPLRIENLFDAASRSFIATHGVERRDFVDYVLSLWCYGALEHHVPKEERAIGILEYVDLLIDDTELSRHCNYQSFDERFIDAIDSLTSNLKPWLQDLPLGNPNTEVETLYVDREWEDALILKLLMSGQGA